MSENSIANKKNKRISVEEYLLNKELLEVKKYVPYANKVLLIDAILKEVCFNKNGLFTLDSVVLDRVKLQIFIEEYTNLNLSIKNQNELNGYDLLIMNREFDNVIDKFKDEFKELERILNLRLDDYLRDKSSLKGFLNYKIERIIGFLDYKTNNLIETINNVDVDKLTNSLSTILDNITKRE